MESDRLTFRLGPLSKPMAAYCAKHGVSASQLCRRLLAKALGVAEPDMPAHGLETLTSEQKSAAGKLGGRTKREA